MFLSYVALGIVIEVNEICVTSGLTPALHSPIFARDHLQRSTCLASRTRAWQRFTLPHLSIFRPVSMLEFRVGAQEENFLMVEVHRYRTQGSGRGSEVGNWLRGRIPRTRSLAFPVYLVNFLVVTDREDINAKFGASNGGESG